MCLQKLSLQKLRPRGTPKQSASSAKMIREEECVRKKEAMCEEREREIDR
jgi:hypothetical protein